MSLATLMPGAHRRGKRDGLDVTALGRSRLHAQDLVVERTVVLGEGLGLEGDLADVDMADAIAIGAILDLAALELANGLGDIGE